ncbi:hypothetical protein DIPPA_27740 [Diplonema papillatum]|nr:hypothetical protein DIPPA_27740 [Diplonema papillatum]
MPAVHGSYRACAAGVVCSVLLRVAAGQGVGPPAAAEGDGQQQQQGEVDAGSGGAPVWAAFGVIALIGCFACLLYASRGSWYPKPQGSSDASSTDETSDDEENPGTLIEEEELGVNIDENELFLETDDDDASPRARPPSTCNGSPRGTPLKHTGQLVLSSGRRASFASNSGTLAHKSDSGGCLSQAGGRAGNLSASPSALSLKNDNPLASTAPGACRNGSFALTGSEAGGRGAGGYQAAADATSQCGGSHADALPPCIRRRSSVGNGSAAAWPPLGQSPSSREPDENSPGMASSILSPKSEEPLQFCRKRESSVGPTSGHNKHKRRSSAAMIGTLERSQFATSPLAESLLSVRDSTPLFDTFHPNLQERRRKSCGAGSIQPLTLHACSSPSMRPFGPGPDPALRDGVHQPLHATQQRRTSMSSLRSSVIGSPCGNGSFGERASNLGSTLNSVVAPPKRRRPSAAEKTGIEALLGAQFPTGEPRGEKLYYDINRNEVASSSTGRRASSLDRKESAKKLVQSRRKSLSSPLSSPMFLSPADTTRSLTRSPGKQRASDNTPRRGSITWFKKHSSFTTLRQDDGSPHATPADLPPKSPGTNGLHRSPPVTSSAVLSSHVRAQTHRHKIEPDASSTSSATSTPQALGTPALDVYSADPPFKAGAVPQWAQSPGSSSAASPKSVPSSRAEEPVLRSSLLKRSPVSSSLKNSTKSLSRGLVQAPVGPL